jgi:hypothetical protein
LVFWLEPGITQESANLDITLSGKLYSFPLTLDITKDLRDYSILSDMYELSLQEKSLSCESAAAADIIESFTGKYTHEDEVISLLPR